MEKLYWFGAWLLGIGLVILGLGALLLPEASSVGYGVPTDAPTWVRAAGARDLVLGVATLTFLLRRADALPLLLPAMAILPFVDVVLVGLAGRGFAATLPHAVGTVGIIVLIVLSRWVGDAGPRTKNA